MILKDMEKVVIITGASRGIGKDIAIQLAKLGYRVIANYNKSEKEAIMLKEYLKEQNIDIEIFKADVSKRVEANELIKFVLDKYKKIDVLINNAGISKYKLFTKITDEEWKEMLDNNLNSVFYMTQGACINMIHNKSGCIINISSIWGMVGASMEVHYSTSKAAINGMTKALAKELGPSNIRVNAIAPGLIRTDMNKDLEVEEENKIKNETPLERLGNPIDISRCIKWLIEDEFTTGQIISINGGWVIV